MLMLDNLESSELTPSIDSNSLAVVSLDTLAANIELGYALTAN